MNIKRLVVLILCGAFLAVLFGCGKNKKDRHVLDGPGMINPSSWDCVTVSRSDSYAQHNFYIRILQTNDGLLVTGEVRKDDGTICEEEEGILLPKAAANSIYDLEPALLPDCVEATEEENGVEVLDMSLVQIEVVFTDGRVLNKVDAGDFSIRVYQIVMPYFKEPQE